MLLPLDLLYLFGLGLASPVLIVRWLRSGRLRTRLAGFFPKYARQERETVWFHGVSVGEVHLLTTLVAAYRKRHPDQAVVVSSTTETGLTEARARFADLTVVRFPFDFSWNCRAAIIALKPKLLVLAESELWPNVLAVANEFRVPVVVVNGRMSPRSYARQRRFAGIVRGLLLNRVAHFAMQSEDYAKRLIELGIPSAKVSVTGSVKYDGAAGDRTSPKAVELRRLLALDGPNPPPVLVAGSTHAPEEMLILDVFAKLRSRFPELRLILVPRSPDRFAEVAAMTACVRRSTIAEPLAVCPKVVILDTIGELGAAWSLATVGFTGGSFDGKRGGQSMIEPAGYGVPVVFGPHIWNFKDAAENLVRVSGAKMAKTTEDLVPILEHWLNDEQVRQAAGKAARRFVQSQQGAVERTLEVQDAVMSIDDASSP